MKIILVIAALAVGFFLVQRSCIAPSEAKNVTFTGAWKVTQENGISGTKSEVTMAVTASKDKFRIVEQGEGSEKTTVYDGDMLYTKYAYAAQPALAAQPQDAGADGAPRDAALSAPQTASEKPRGPNQLAQLRFWARSYVGRTGPGGKMADRDTVLYQAREKRPDGELTIQAWVDAQTGVVLKSVTTIYSSQVGSMVSKTTEECQQIQYDSADPSAFSKP